MENSNQVTKDNHQKYEDLIVKLTSLNIDYKLVHHAPAETIQQADQFIANLKGVRTKSMLLRDKKNNFYLVIMDDSKRLDFKHFQEVSGKKRLSLAKENEVEELLNLEPGIISPFGVMYSEGHDVDIYFDKDMLDQETLLTFHPNENTHTIFLEAEDLMKFIKSYGYTYNVLTV
ncbi:prolyl-tRNA synthetase associated domain-containing protein [Weissella koreensis]|uniref:Prolyl-tRNA synthetase associated domain-containing protein n=1 Tax=Weissella koreensis TaxID=165096 RepID=A0A7H1MKR8_9LACO|nr:prolyl-tRNA synthetase associated domain-containing protein [Weissella koreensis]AVH74851.1 prolyl-tRNA synthetase associated domain-containing protein [Weissella koreensis]EJF33809.1 YbaK/prolyl-tRNA synthetase associated protein [Weissella koreensis KCTC 3621]QGN20075.1 prolyl-tRNA synthetase associated domain-containing protein [Weissella koreensis]QNT64054.1 prolyl-tRNA synthetase associated domain-containing protein [Weissella koreensis]